jgi:hypothetical protein
MKLISTEAADRQVAPVAIPGEPCPTCRQRVPDAQNVFATGAYGAVPIRTIEPTDPLEPDGPGYAEVMCLLRETSRWSRWPLLRRTSWRAWPDAHHIRGL